MLNTLESSKEDLIGKDSKVFDNTSKTIQVLTRNQSKTRYIS